MRQTEGYLIRRTKWSDTSLITTWITRDAGKLRLLAKGALRATGSFAGKLDLFFHADLGYAAARASDLHTLREIRLVSAFDASSVPCANVYLCGYFAELVDRCTEPEHPCPGIYELFGRAVTHLQAKSATHRALEHFEEELCRALGVHNTSCDRLAQLQDCCGRIPASRAPALRMLAKS